MLEDKDPDPNITPNTNVNTNSDDTNKNRISTLTIILISVGVVIFFGGLYSLYSNRKDRKRRIDYKKERGFVGIPYDL